MQHQPVLLQEAIAALNIQAEGVYIDATFGRGGHSQAILQQLNQQGQLLAFDCDPAAAQVAANISKSNFHFCNASYTQLKQQVINQDYLGRVQGILLDAGVSSPQLDDPKRGFSFMRDGPLDMRMDPRQGISAADWVAKVSEQDLIRILKEYGEERFAKRIARAIIEQRQQQAISTTGQLAAIIADAVPFREPGKHPATRSFQAIRIMINQELEQLAQVLEQSLAVLAPGGRLVVISFHSLEDRIVKQFIKRQAKGDDYPRDFPITSDQIKPKMHIIGKAVYASETEVNNNPRARSAVMRVAERTEHACE